MGLRRCVHWILWTENLITLSALTLETSVISCKNISSPGDTRQSTEQTRMFALSHGSLDLKETQMNNHRSKQNKLRIYQTKIKAQKKTNKQTKILLHYTTNNPDMTDT